MNPVPLRFVRADVKAPLEKNKKNEKATIYEPLTKLSNPNVVTFVHLNPMLCRNNIESDFGVAGSPKTLQEHPNNERSSNMELLAWGAHRLLWFLSCLQVSLSVLNDDASLQKLHDDFRVGLMLLDLLLGLPQLVSD